MTSRYETQPDGTVRVFYDPPESNPNYGECGEAIECDGESVVIKTLGPSDLSRFVDDLSVHIDELHRRAQGALPAGTVYEIRGMMPQSYGRRYGVAWYHVDAMKDWPVTGSIVYPGKRNELGGYMMLGTFRTPEPA